MLKNIFTVTFRFTLCLFLLSINLFSGANTAIASQMDTSMNDKNSMGIVIEESEDDLNASKPSATPDLGDDQAFPFIPGFGKNSGKD